MVNGRGESSHECHIDASLDTRRVIGPVLIAIRCRGQPTGVPERAGMSPEALGDRVADRDRAPGQDVGSKSAAMD